MSLKPGDTVRVGIIGQGRSGYSIHCRYLKTDDRYKITAIVDPLEERRKNAEEEFGCDTYADYRDMLKRDDLDLVVNATPSHLHVPVTKDILAAGHNVICEKPLARTAAEVDELIAAAKESGQFFTIFQQSRYAPYFQKVREIIDSGVLGRIVLIKIAFNNFARRWDWQTLQDMNGGNLYNTGPHPMDQALQLFGTDTMPNILCVMDRANTFGDAEDFVKVLLTGEGRPTVDLEISSCDAYPLFTYHIHGTLGGLTGKMTELKWKYYKPEEAPDQQLIREPLPKQAYCSEKLPMHEDSWTVPEAQKDLFHTISGGYYGDLYKALTEGAEFAIKPEHVRQQIAVIEECHRQNPLSRLDD